MDGLEGSGNVFAGRYKGNQSSFHDDTLRYNRVVPGSRF